MREGVVTGVKLYPANATAYSAAGVTDCKKIKPVIITYKDCQALRTAATSGEVCYFLGTDSALHPMTKKLSINGIPAIFNAPVTLAAYAKVFEEDAALGKSVPLMHREFTSCKNYVLNRRA